MTKLIESSILCILHPNGKIAGTGFLVGPQLAVTCAHVVVAANAIDGDTIQVQFSGRAGKLSALVEPKYWRDVDKGDVAFLRLDAVPAGIEPQRLGAAQTCRPGSAFRSFGYATAAEVQGIHANGTIDGYLPQHKLLQLQSPQANHGISGGPVLDEARGVVVGMITKGHIELGRNEQTTFATPTELLFEICPEIQPAETCPYLGLKAFTAETAQFFFGREALAQKLFAALRGGCRFLAVFGPSGSGKSSVVRAGLLPKLVKGQFTGWKQVTLRPTDDPFTQLKNAGLESLSNLSEKTILFIDQFEELFTLCSEDQRTRFVAALAAALEDSRLTLIISMRDDFYSAFHAKTALLAQSEHLKIENVPATLKPDELTEMIERPSAAVGLQLEDGLAELILRDLTRDGETRSSSLPLLEFALTQLWEQRRDGLLTHDAYQAIGGVTGSLARWADEAYSDLPKADRSLAESLLISLVHPGYETQGLPDTRRRGSLTEFDEPTLRAVKHFVDRRLLVTSGENVELVHDALLREWERLRTWLNIDRDNLRLREDVAENARRWESAHRDESLLNHRGPRLELALTMSKNLRYRLNPVELAYLDRCVELSQQEKAAAARLRRQTIAGISVALVVIMAILVGWGWSSNENSRQLGFQVATATYAQGFAQQQAATAEEAKAIAQTNANVAATAQKDEKTEKENAEQQARISQSRELSAQADALREKNFALSLLLGIESFQKDDNVQTRGVLLDNVQAKPQLLGFLNGHTDIVTTVAFSPDGRFLASGGWDGTIFIWDINSRKTVGQPLHKQFLPVNSVAFSPDGKILASGSSDGTIVLWNVATHQTIAQPLIAHTDKVNSVIFSPDGHILASGSTDRTIILWDVETLQPLGQPLNQHLNDVSSLAFSPDGKFLASGSHDHTVILWDVATHLPIGQPLSEHAEAIYSVAFSPNGKILASGSWDGVVIFWDIATRKPIGQPHKVHATIVTGLAFSPDGDTLASSSHDRTIILWDVVRQQPIGQPLQGHRDSVESVVFSPNGKFLASASMDHTLILWSIQMNQGIDTPLVGSAGKVTSIAFSPDDKILASGDTDHSVLLWDLKTQQIIGKPLNGHTDIVSSVAFSPDGKILASASWDKTIILWNIATHEAIGQPLRGHYNFISTISFSPDGKTLASGGADGQIIIWDMATYQPFGQPIKWPVVSAINSVVFSPDGTALAAASFRDIIVWNTKTLKPIGQPLNAHTDYVYNLAFSPDGKLLASASYDRTIILWDVNTHQPVGEPLVGHTDYIMSVAFSSDGNILASGSSDRTIILWSVTTHQPIGQPLTGHKDEVYSVTFSPDGKTLASGSLDRTIVLWNIDPHFWVEKSCQRVGRNFTYSEWQQYIGDALPYQAVCSNLPIDPEPIATPTPLQP